MMSRCPLGTGKEDCAPSRGSFVRKGAVRQERVLRGRRVGKMAKAERGGPLGPAESLDLLQSSHAISLCLTSLTYTIRPSTPMVNTCAFVNLNLYNTTDML